MATKNIPTGDNSVIAFLRQVKTELKKVDWPSREETIRLTTIVVIVSVIVGAYLGSLDFLFTKLMGFVL